MSDEVPERAQKTGIICNACEHVMIVEGSDMDESQNSSVDYCNMYCTLITHQILGGVKYCSKFKLDETKAK